jgi:hypothetical protein
MMKGGRRAKVKGRRWKGEGLRLKPEGKYLMAKEPVMVSE